VEVSPVNISKRDLQKRARKAGRKAGKTIQHETTAKRTTLFFIGAAGTIGGFLLGRRGALRYAGGVAKGMAHRATPGSDSSTGTLNDPALARKVESEIFRDADAPNGSVNVNVENGIVYLRGQVERSEDIEALVAKAEKVDGVHGVESLLHLPGTPAKMKR
jgi:BON domain